MPGLGAAFVHGCLLPEQLPCQTCFQTAPAKASCLSAVGTSWWHPGACKIFQRNTQFILWKARRYLRLRGGQGGGKYIQMSPSMQGTGHFFYPDYCGCQQRTFLGAGDPQRSMMSSHAASMGWILSLVRSVLPGVCLDVCRNFYKLVS